MGLISRTGETPGQGRLSLYRVMNLPRNTKHLLSILVASLLLFSQLAYPQGLPTLSGAKSTVAPAAQADPLKRDTPRSAIYAFLEACHGSKFDLAAQYLDLRRVRSDLRVAQGPQLAQQLATVLDRDTKFEVGRLSNDPAGNTSDGLASNLEKLDTFDINEQIITLYLQRQQVDGQELWLVSSDSVLRIPQLAAAIEESPIEKRLPAVLVTNRVIGTPLWIWLALFFAALLVTLISRLLARIALGIIRPIAHRYSKLHLHRIETFISPLRLMLSVVLFRTCIEFIGPSALLRDALLKLLALLAIWAVASILMGIVDVISDTIISRLDVRERAVSYSVIPLLVRSAKIILGFLAILWVLGAWGYNVNAVLAGLGVGGIAVALAAQKTIENLFGGISVISDKPVLVGDFCQFGGQVGTIEDIGLRSTKIRTLDRTIVTIPNSSFSTMTLENFSKRDRMWFHPTIYLRRDTPPEKIRAMMDAIVDVLKSHPKVDPTDVPLRFTKIAKESFDLEIFSYVNSDDFNVFLQVQSELLLGIVEAAVRLSVEFAVPIQEAFAPGKAGSMAGLHPANLIASNNAPTTGS